MASDAFFPFPDCVEIAGNVGVKTVIQPGGSIKDQLSIDYCNENDIAMVFTGIRHFKTLIRKFLSFFYWFLVSFNKN